MDLLLPLISLLLVAGGGGGWLGSFVDAATTAVPNLEEVSSAAYWEAVLPGTPMPPAIINLLLAQQNVHTSPDDIIINANNLKSGKGTRKIGSYYEKLKLEPAHEDKHVHISSQVEEEAGKIFATHRTNMGENIKEILVSYGLEGKTYLNKVLPNLKKIFATYKPRKQDNIKEISISYGSKGGKDETEVSRAYGLEGEKELKEISLSYGVEGEDVLKEISVSYEVEVRKSLKGAPVSYGKEQEGKLKEISMSYGLDEGKCDYNKFLNRDAEDPHKATMSYGSEHEEDPHKATMSYGSEIEEDPHKATVSYGSEHEDDPHKATMSYGSENEEDPHKATVSYGSEHEDDPHKATMSYGSEHEEDPYKATMSYGSGHEKDLKTFSTGHATHLKGEGSHHAHSHEHGNKKQADVFFFHDMLRPGSVITPTIPLTTSLPARLPHGIAKSIPFSKERLSDIMAIFAPASLAMAREIRWTLDTCDHPRPLPGQKAGCATSLESLAELAASLHGTHNVRAFSAANLPVDAKGTPVLRGMYNVTAVRKLSDSPEIVTCHDLTYPYTVYYCHTANPTSAYTVTLESVDGAMAPAVMEALAVCHLDTSRWSPKNPFFELHNLKPGDVAVCHFLTKLSIIWVRGGEQGDTHAAAR